MKSKTCSDSFAQQYSQHLLALSILLILSVFSTMAQDVRQITIAKQKSLKDEVTAIESDIRRINAFINSLQDATDSNKQLKNLKKQLEDKKHTLALRSFEFGSDAANELVNEQSASSEDKVVLSADLAIRPNNQKAADMLSPALFAFYKKSTNCFLGLPDWLAQYDFTFSIQSNKPDEDLTKTISRILSSGSDGYLQLGFKTGAAFSGGTVAFGLVSKINWLNSQSSTNVQTPAFAFVATGLTFAAGLGPAVIGYQTEYRYVTGETDSPLAKLIDKAMSGSFLVALNTDSYQIQLRYLFNTNREKISNENLEIRLGTSYSPF